MAGSTEVEFSASKGIDLNEAQMPFSLNNCGSGS